jgi:PHD/YefM family antitoxin component YafN of YafNO toxin-antitoxin module
MYEKAAVTYNSSMASMTVSDFRQNLAAAVEASMAEAVFVQRHGTTIGVFVRPEVYAELQEAWEELEDLRAYRAARDEGGSAMPWEQVKAELGW